MIAHAILLHGILRRNAYRSMPGVFTPASRMLHTAGTLGAGPINADVERAEEKACMVAAANAHMKTVGKDSFIQRVAHEHRYKVPGKKLHWESGATVSFKPPSTARPITRSHSVEPLYELKQQ
eukprot:9482510-Pyramimonas_sp.AAC.1